jgi:hypothetical protein
MGIPHPVNSMPRNMCDFHVKSQLLLSEFKKKMDCVNRLLQKSIVKTALNMCRKCQMTYPELPAERRR